MDKKRILKDFLSDLDLVAHHHTASGNDFSRTNTKITSNDNWDKVTIFFSVHDTDDGDLGDIYMKVRFRANDKYEIVDAGCRPHGGRWINFDKALKWLGSEYDRSDAVITVLADYLYVRNG